MKELLYYGYCNNRLRIKHSQDNLLSLDYDYIPIYIMNCYKYMGYDDCFIFQKISQSLDSTNCYNLDYKEIGKLLNEYSKIFKIILDEDKGQAVGFSKGYIEDYNTKEILMCLCTNDHKTLTTSYHDIYLDANPETFKLFISENLFLDSKYKVLLDSLLKNYLPHIRKYDIDIILCHNVEKNIFNKQEEQIIDFDTIDELQEELNSLTRYLSYDLSYYNEQFISDEYGLRLNIIDDVREIVLVNDTNHLIPVG